MNEGGDEIDFTLAGAKRVPADVKSRESGLPVYGSDEFVSASFYQHIKKGKGEIAFLLESESKGRVKRVEMFKEIVAFALILEHREGVVHIPEIHQRLLDVSKKQHFLVADKDVGESRTKR